MGLGNAIRIGKKILSSAVRIGQKVLPFAKKVLRIGSKVNEVKQAVVNKDGMGVLSAISGGEERVKPPPQQPQQPQPKAVFSAPIQKERKLQPLAKGLETAGGVRKVFQTAKAIKKEIKATQQLLQGTTPLGKAKIIDRANKKIKAVSEAPSKRSFEKTAKEQRAIQQSQLVGKMTKKEFKKFQKQQEKRSKKKSRGRK